VGTLVAWHYPTPLFANLADHTYVACGTGGKAWNCWGGKTGGTPLRRGPGSTLRADAIAEPNERANVKCYLVNGVCHQAANRILLPAGITVRGAKGYWVSEALYGPYGRERGFLGFCKAPFHQHPGVTGDLPECEEPAAPPDEKQAAAVQEAEEGESGEMADYLSRARSLYREVEPMVVTEGLDTAEARTFQMRLFDLLADFRLGEGYTTSSDGQAAREVRGDFEARREALEEAFFRHEIGVDTFVDEYNRLMEEYQYRTAEVLPEERYEALFALPPGEPVVLGDPEVARAAYPDR